MHVHQVEPVRLHAGGIFELDQRAWVVPLVTSQLACSLISVGALIWLTVCAAHPALALSLYLKDVSRMSYLILHCLWI